jgi:thiol-disulfide isomerase/thioredoxin
MKYKFVLPFLLCSIILIATGILVRYYSLYVDLWVSFVLHFAACFFIIGRLRQAPLRTLLVYLAGNLLFLIDFLPSNEPFITRLIWPNVLPGIIAPVCSFLLFQAKGKAKLLVLGITVTLYLGNIFWFWEKWGTYANFGVSSNHVSQSLPREWNASFLDGQPFNADSLKNRVVLLDFWNSGCAACIRKFPMLDSIYRNSCPIPNSRVYSVFIPFSEKDTPGRAAKIINAHHVTFPVVFGAGLDSVFKIFTYPTVLVINHDRIVFRGKLEEAIAEFKNLTPADYSGFSTGSEQSTGPFVH